MAIDYQHPGAAPADAAPVAGRGAAPGQTAAGVLSLPESSAPAATDLATQVLSEAA